MRNYKAADIIRDLSWQQAHSYNKLLDLKVDITKFFASYVKS